MSFGQQLRKRREELKISRSQLADMLGVTGKPKNVSCVLDLDRDAFADLLVEAVKAYDGWEVRV